MEELCLAPKQKKINDDKESKARSEASKKGVFYHNTGHKKVKICILNLGEITAIAYSGKSDPLIPHVCPPCG